MEKVSIIIPTFNSQKYILKAVESVLYQTYPNIELIIVDDGSTEETNHLLMPYIKNNNPRDNP